MQAVSFQDEVFFKYNVFIQVSIKLAPSVRRNWTVHVFPIGNGAFPQIVS